MKTTRTFASFCLTASCVALIAAANVSVGDQPGVFRMTSAPEVMRTDTGQSGIQPVPGSQFTLGASDAPGTVNMNGSGFAPQNDSDQFLNRSGGVTSSLLGSAAYQSQPLPGPQLTIRQTIDDGVGFRDSYSQFSVLIPNHLIPNQMVVLGDLSASVSDNGDPLYNWGMILRNYDESRNRISGVNFYGDFDYTPRLSEYKRLGVGIESIGRWVDFFFNGYFVRGQETFLSSSTPISGLLMRGNNVVQNFDQVRENAYSGVDAKVGGPLPIIGRRGANMYIGTYYLGSEFGDDALGLSLEWQVLATESLTFSAFYTNDETFGTNSWFSVAYTLPNTREKRILKPRTVRERMMDPTQRTSTIHAKVERSLVGSVVINPKTGLPWTIVYVDPNLSGMGTGTVEDPFMTFQQAVDSNTASIDAIRVAPRVDGTGTNLTAMGGIDLFDFQALFSGHKDFALFRTAGVPFVIAADPDADTDADGPIISNPTMAGPADSVIRVASFNRINGLHIDAANATGDVFGIGVDAPAAFDSVELTSNTLTNHTVGANFPDAEGTLLIAENTFTGSPATATHGLMLMTTLGSSSDLMLEMNTATGNSVAGLYAQATAGSTMTADNPLGLPIGGATPRSGIIDNTTMGNGDGIVVLADTNARIDALVERNTSTDNTLSAAGFVGTADGAGALFNLVSMRGNDFSMNGEDGAILHYLNDGNFMSVTEDVDGDGVLGPGEDLNGNGLLDQGIVSNSFSNNIIAGLCIFGEGDPGVDDSGTGGSSVFDIGGPQSELGNDFIGNLGASIAVDLQDSATSQMDTVNNLFTDMGTAAVTDPTLTFVLDFWETSQGTLTDTFGNDIIPFDVTGFGFADADFDMVTDAILDQVRDHFYNIPTMGTDARSPIPNGRQLSIDFVVGDLGTDPSNGATEFYYAVIGGSSSSGTPLGLGFLSSARAATGIGPNFGFTNGDQLLAIYSDNINGLGGLTPADIGSDHPSDLAVAGDNQALRDALTSGNLTFTRNALGGTTSHEIGHTVSLLHMNVAGSVTPTGAPPIMGTGAIDTPNQARIGLREFSYEGQNAEAGSATQFHVQQLMDALGTRPAFVGGSGHGINIVGADSSRLLPSTWLNNTIENRGGDALSISMNEAARAEGVTIQTNTIRNNTGRGINLEANGALAFIEASNTIGGSGINLLAGTEFAQGNTVTGNQSDGIRTVASNGGVIQGNIIDNTIVENAGNGVALLIDGGGVIDFGTPTSDRIISGNTIGRNAGRGILAASTVDATVSNADQEMNILLQGNVINQNVSGGLVAELHGTNNVPPGPPAVGFNENNVLNLTIGQTTLPFTTPVASESNLFDRNGEVGIGVVINGNGLANVDIVNNTITNTTAGSDPTFNGDGINLIRRDSSLLADTSVLFNTITGNASNGLEVDTQGWNKDDPNQPMTGTANSITWNNNVLSNNGENGASFRTRGDSQLFANGLTNVLMGNGASGVLVTTSENSAFGDPTMADPDHRVVFNGLTIDSNGRDGFELISMDNSNLLLEITSERIATTSGAHATLNTTGDMAITNNFRDGIHIESGDTSTVDILIAAETPVTSTSAVTLIDGNGTGPSGGNGIFWDSFDDTGGMVQVYNTIITNSLAGATEDTNGDGVLIFAEDTAGNFDQNQISPAGIDTSGNLDIDVANGDGMQFNYFHNSTSTLLFGRTGEGNIVQNNQDDGIALTGDVNRSINTTDIFGDPLISTVTQLALGPMPTITIQDNLIGGEMDGVVAGNGGDGVSIRSFGHTGEGTDPENVNFNLNDGPLTWMGGAADLFLLGGPTPDITLDTNTITRNNRNGVNIRLQGANSLLTPRDAGIAAPASDFNQITLTDNNISSNAEDGIHFRGDADMNQNRFVYLANFPDPPVADTDNQNFSPFRTEFTGTWGDDYRSPYLNLASVQNTFLTVTGNTMQNNGTNTINGQGIELLVGTGVYLAADVRNNITGGNLNEDFVTGSFFSHVDTSSETAVRIDTFESQDNSGDLTFDFIYLDDVAQLDLRFTDNTGNQILPLENGPFLDTTSTIALDIPALHTNFDDLKFDDIDRDGAVFKIDDAFGLNVPVNSFIEFGVTQDIEAAFSAEYEILNLSAEALWPEVPYQDAD